MAATLRTQTNPPIRDQSGAAREPNGREVVPHRGLPNGRAVVGGLLVAVAALGVFVAVRHADSHPLERYIVARHELHAGQRLAASDLTVRPAELPDVVARRSYTTGRLLVGAIVLGPIAAGELVQRGQIADASRQAGRNQVSFAVNANRAGGELRPGDRIALVLTPSSGGDPQVVAADLEVVSVNRGSSAIESSGRLTILVAADSTQALGVARAVNPDLVTVVRTTGVTGSEQLSVDHGQGS